MPTEPGSEWIRNLYRPGVLERGYRLLAREMDKRLADADIFALASRCEAAAKHFNVTTHAYGVAEFAEPHDQAAEDEAERLQDIASDELDNAALPLILARATTFAGLLAKARALKCAFPGNDCQIALDNALRNDEIFDPAPASLSLARDLIALAGEDA
jgi:hypothetical protein